MLGMVIFLTCYQRLLKKKGLKMKTLIDKLMVVVIASLIAGIVFGATYIAACAPDADTAEIENHGDTSTEITQCVVPQPLEEEGENKVELFI
jgi:hypothetical protein